LARSAHDEIALTRLAHLLIAKAAYVGASPANLTWQKLQRTTNQLRCTAQRALRRRYRGSGYTF
jgi:hypothetical protein